MKKISSLAIATLIFVTEGCSHSNNKKYGNFFITNTAKSLPVFDSDSNNINPIESIYYNFNSSNLTKEARKRLKITANFLNINRNIKMQIQGHCDRRGGVQYNLALGEKRAKKVKKYLMSLGVDPWRLKTISYGKEKPIALGYDGNVRRKNRRINFLVTNRNVLMARTPKSKPRIKIDPFFSIHPFGSLNINSGLNRNGYSIGVRTGYELFSEINLGIDCRIGKINLDRLNTGSNELDVRYYGVYLSYTGVRSFDFWGSWLFDLSEKYNSSNQTLRGRGFLLGTGFNLKSYLKTKLNFRFNLEFARYNFTELEDAGGAILPITSFAGVDTLSGYEFLFGPSVSFSF